MSYLTPFDYDRSIQDVSLQQVISGKPILKLQAEASGITEVKSYLVQKYDVDKEFTDTVAYNPAVTYKAANRVYLTASNYNESATYALNAITVKSGYVWLCTTVITVAEEFNAAHWQKLGAKDSFFYVKYPSPVFNLNKSYDLNDVVFWNDKTYTCLVATRGITHDMLIQYSATYLAPFKNVFPDDPKFGSQFWRDEGSYSVPPSSLLDTNLFTPGDNRNQQMVMYVLDVIIYTLYRRIPPGLVPGLRVAAYEQAIAWLIKVAKSNDVTADLIKIQPASGNVSRFGSRPKLENYY